MPKGETSKDPVQFPAKSQSTPLPDDGVNSGLLELTQLARQAFEDKRRKQCLTLTSAILKIDPENKEALVLQSWMRASLQKDMETAQTLLVEARASNSLPLYDRAERSLRGILGVDAENAEAKALLREVVTSQVGLTQTRPIEEEEIDLLDSPPTPFLGRRQNRVVLGVVLGALAILGVAGVAWFRTSDDPQSQEEPGSAEAENTSEPALAPGIAPGSIELLTVPTRGVQVAVDDSPPRPAPQVLELAPGQHRFVFTAAGYVPETVTATVVSGTKRILPILMKSVSSDSGTAPVAAAREPEPRAPANEVRPPARASNDPPRTAPARTQNSPPPVAADPTGTLSVDAAVPVDVYRAGRKVGTTPLKLPLPAGSHTLEYRWRSQQKTMSHAITANRTTEATVVFEVSLDINSTPWAEVSVEGSSRRLGETPLSNVTATVGSVLVFTNPNFGQKKHRVTGNDGAIQMVFP